MSSLFNGTVSKALRPYPTIVTKTDTDTTRDTTTTDTVTLSTHNNNNNNNITTAEVLCPSCHTYSAHSSPSSLYKCSTCSNMYCTSSCFKSHNSSKCYEIFCNRKVTEHENLRSKDPQNKITINDILDRTLNSQKNGDLESYSDVSSTSDSELEILENLSSKLSVLSASSVLDSLPPDLKSEFLSTLDGPTSLEILSSYMLTLRPFVSLTTKKPNLCNNLYYVILMYEVCVLNEVEGEGFKDVCDVFGVNFNLREGKRREGVVSEVGEIVRSKGWKGLKVFEDKCLRECLDVLRNVRGWVKGKEKRKVDFYASWCLWEEGERMWEEFLRG